MKTRKTPESFGKPHGKRSRNSKKVVDPDHMTEMLKLCLQKICELQADMQQEEENSHDPEVEGYTACAMETFRFLSAQGLPPDHPVVRALSEKLLRNRD